MGLNRSLLSLREANPPLIQSGSRSTRSIRRINVIRSDLFFDLSAWVIVSGPDALLSYNSHVQYIARDLNANQVSDLCDLFSCVDPVALTTAGSLQEGPNLLPILAARKYTFV